VRTILAVIAATTVAAGCGGAPGSPSTQTKPAVTAQPVGTAQAVKPTTATSLAVPVPKLGELTQGRYTVPAGDWTATTVSYEIAEPGWFAQNLGQTISKNPDDDTREISFSISIVDALFAEPCGANERLPIGPATKDLITALASLPGLRMSAPQTITIGGQPGQMVMLSMSAGLQEELCDPPIGLQVWLDRPGGKYLVVGEDLETRVYATDVDGERFMLNVNYKSTADPADLTAFDAIVESIRFGE
jgi:hypothetical protein